MVMRYIETEMAAAAAATAHTHTHIHTHTCPLGCHLFVCVGIIYSILVRLMHTSWYNTYSILVLVMHTSSVFSVFFRVLL